METPPRVWGRPENSKASMCAKRNTPTGVGKTYGSFTWLSIWRKHPHGCGEDNGDSPCFLTPLETPPRVWGRPPATAAASRLIRNTPTGVGKTTTPRLRLSLTQKHPHGCGEDVARLFSDWFASETPPRVWGRHHIGMCVPKSKGNTPTGVGKTYLTNKLREMMEKHPHGCGEDGIAVHAPEVGLETPPRVWGRQRHLSCAV